MGLDILMVGGKQAKAAQEDLEFAVLVNYLVNTYPEIARIDLGEPDHDLEEGHRLGTYSDLHLLRGLAVAIESPHCTIEAMNEADFNREIEKYYENPSELTAFPHLIDHRDDGGYYVPIVLDLPLSIEAEIEGRKDPIVTVAGSSFGLLDELNRLNSHIQMPGDLGELGSTSFEALATAHRWPTIAFVWGVLRYYARESSEKLMFIQFA